MRVFKLINNNVVSAFDENKKEIILMGRGLGFKAKEGDLINQDKVEKVFYIQDQTSNDKLKMLLRELPLEHIELSSDIITYAKECLGKQLNENIYITLTDHINFAIMRYRQGMMFENVLLMEVRRFYNQEYHIGMYALKMIEERFDIKFPPDEAASIALHIVNAELQTNISETISIVNLLPKIVGKINDFFEMKIIENNIFFESFATHLRFFHQSISKNEPLTENDPNFCKMVKDLYPKEFECAKDIGKIVIGSRNHRITDEEISYIALHIKRIIST